MSMGDGDPGERGAGRGASEGADGVLPEAVERTLASVGDAAPGVPSDLDGRVRAAAAGELRRIAGTAAAQAGGGARGAGAIPLRRERVKAFVGGFAAAALVGVVALVGIDFVRSGGGGGAGGAEERLALRTGEPEREGGAAELSLGSGAASLGDRAAVARREPGASQAARADVDGARGGLMDTNGDGVIDVLDAFRVARGVRDGAVRVSWDVTRDGTVDRGDVDLLLAAAVRLNGAGIESEVR